MRVIIFDKLGYEPFVDFIKAYAIICVLIGHTIPKIDSFGYGLWAGMQVPLFVLIQTFHIYKKDSYKINIKKWFCRIIIPFVFITCLICLYFLLIGHNKGEILHDVFLLGGYGPGAYYPWVYLQLALVIPLLKPFITKGTLFLQAVIFMVLCESIEVFMSFLDFPDYLYRLLFIRYLFLIYLGFVWVKRGIVINWKTIILSIISLMAIIYFEYFSVDDEPLFYNTSWKFHRWPCYFYVSNLLCYMLYVIYKKACISNFVMKCVQSLAKCSYEIFLMQMMIITLYPSFSNISSLPIRFGIKTIPIWIISIVGGMVFNKAYNGIMNYMK